MKQTFRVKWGPSILGLVFHGARNLTRRGKWETDPAKLPESLRQFLNLRVGHRVTFGDFDYGGQDARRSPEDFAAAVEAGEDALSGGSDTVRPARASGGHLCFDCTVDVEPKDRPVRSGAAGEIVADVVRLLREESSFKNGHNEWVCEFGWKDAKLEACGCTGIESIEAKGARLIVNITGHKTFCLVCEGNNDAPDPDAVDWDGIEEISREIAGGTGHVTGADSDSISFGVEDSISVRVRRGEDAETVARRVHAAASKFVEKEWEPGWIEASEEMDKLWNDVKAGLYNRDKVGA